MKNIFDLNFGLLTSRGDGPVEQAIKRLQALPQRARKEFFIGDKEYIKNCFLADDLTIEQFCSYADHLIDWVVWNQSCNKFEIPVLVSLPEKVYTGRVLLHSGEPANKRTILAHALYALLESRYVPRSLEDFL